jgi:DNA polymerase III epsilon subunit family exonuclease
MDLSVLPEQFVIVDLETTGLNPLKHEIIEIGAIKVNRDSINHITFQALLKPKNRIPKMITEITGITQDMVDKDGENLESVMMEFIKFIGDLHLVAYNAEFDMGFLKAVASSFGIAINNQCSCALKMARRAWPGLESYKLVNLANVCGLSTKDSHRALKDCELTITVYSAAALKLNSIS